ncbi:HNH endonuclease family protein [Streptomyces hoynatensis]|uniref:HNH endonuclease family protein n=1 Tax=Streptomyces hoynatensis TaxID=1141874 RepID=UPI001F4EA7A2|nr:HNH endonuclease family protein [Streptomyces hoynatensis]
MALTAAATLLALGGCDATEEPADGAGRASATDPGSPGTSTDSPRATGGPGATELPGLPTPEAAGDMLAGLDVAQPRPMTGYSRDRFPHWTSEEGCTVRERVLLRDGRDVTAGEDCAPVSGRWHSPYDGADFTDPGDLDIDHVVPLANAWRSGADEWTDEQREAFANDLDHPQLLAVSARSNREKGDQSPDEWLPPRAEFGCTYALAWTAVKDAYGLSVTAAEREALATLLDTCP